MVTWSRPVYIRVPVAVATAFRDTALQAAPGVLAPQEAPRARSRSGTFGHPATRTDTGNAVSALVSERLDPDTENGSGMLYTGLTRVGAWPSGGAAVVCEQVTAVPTDNAGMPTPIRCVLCLLVVLDGEPVRPCVTFRGRLRGRRVRHVACARQAVLAPRGGR